MKTKVTSAYVERCQPYQVLMTCGHIEKRMMREATAGVPWAEDVVLTAKAPCAECDLSKRTFPLFETHEIAASRGCRSCAGKLHAEDATDKGYPQSRGRYSLKCRKCEATLFYDLPRTR